MNTTPAPTTPDPAATIRTEQILELLAQHIASNDRVVSTLERVEEKIPEEAERILQEHRLALDKMPAPIVRVPPSEVPEVKRYLGGLINLWGTVIVALVVLGTCTILFYVFR